MTETESIQLPLSLRPRRGESPDAVDAWFIPGSDPHTWLGEICRWGISTESMRLMVVPQSRSKRQAIGVLVLASSKPNAIAMAQPCVRVGGRLYVPASSVLYPP